MRAKSSSKLVSKNDGKSYPIPDVEPRKWNYEDDSRPSNLNGDNENAEYCNVHRNSQSYKEGEEEINISLI